MFYIYEVDIHDGSITMLRGKGKTVDKAKAAALAEWNQIMMVSGTKPDIPGTDVFANYEELSEFIDQRDQVLAIIEMKA